MDLIYFPKFNLYNVMISKDAKEKIPYERVKKDLDRHKSGDWGIVDLKGWRENEEDCVSKENNVVGCYEYITEDGDIILYNITTNFAKKETVIETLDEIMEDLDKSLGIE